MFSVQLGTLQMMAESVPFGETPIENPDEILTKEQAGLSDKNIWDEEW